MRSKDNPVRVYASNVKVVNMDQTQELQSVQVVRVQLSSEQQLAMAVPREHLLIRKTVLNVPLGLRHWAPLRMNAILVQLADLVKFLQKEHQDIVVQIVPQGNGVILLQEHLLPFVMIAKVEDLASQSLLPP